MNDILMARAKSKLDLSMSSLPILKVCQIKKQAACRFRYKFSLFHYIFVDIQKKLCYGDFTEIS